MNAGGAAGVAAGTLPVGTAPPGLQGRFRVRGSGLCLHGFGFGFAIFFWVWSVGSRGLLFTVRVWGVEEVL